MTNLDIIYMETINHGIFTKIEADELLNKYGCLPVWTYAEWKKQGYCVKKGEKAKFKTKLWKKRNIKPSTEEGKEGNEKDQKSGFFLITAALFTREQVERMQ